MPIASWDDPFTLTTPFGTITFNDDNNVTGLFLLIASGCQFGPESVRLTKTNVPQADGSILHRRFLPGMNMTLAVRCLQNREALACDEQLVDMVDLLIGCTRSLLNAGDNQGRIAWEPEGKQTRMLDDIRLFQYLTQTVDDRGAGTFVFAVDSQYPYAEDLTQEENGISGGGSDNLVNTGTADFFPVFKVAGTMSSFTITVTNLAWDYQATFIYNGATVTTPNYAEIDCFRNTIYEIEMPSMVPSTNLKAGVDQINSEYPVFKPGTNTVAITGAGMTVLWQAAWG